MPAFTCAQRVLDNAAQSCWPSKVDVRCALSGLRYSRPPAIRRTPQVITVHAARWSGPGGCVTVGRLEIGHGTRSTDCIAFRTISGEASERQHSHRHSPLDVDARRTRDRHLYELSGISFSS